MMSILVSSCFLFAVWNGEKFRRIESRLAGGGGGYLWESFLDDWDAEFFVGLHVL